MNMKETKKRDEASIDAFLGAIREEWLRRPGLSFGRLIAGASRDIGLNGLYYMDDSGLIDLIRLHSGE